jgi:hypothetical protein
MVVSAVAILAAQPAGAVAKTGPVRAKAKIVHRTCPKSKPPRRMRRPVCPKPRTATATKARRQPAPPKPTSKPPASVPTPAGSPASAPTLVPTAEPSQSQAPTLLPSGQASAWDEPTLVNPIVITLSSTRYNLALPQNQDYILQCPNGPVVLPGVLSIWGGHNVVIQHCDFEANNNWVAYLHNTGGTLWVDDVHFGGTNLTGGVQLQEPGATVVMRDVLFDTVYGSLNTNHAELIQTWAGPSRLMIDGLTGSTTYQGLFLQPNQFDNGPPPTVFDLRHIDIDDSQGAYALWLGSVNGSPSGDESSAILSWNVQDVYVLPNPARTWPGWWLWPQPSTGDPTWDSVIAGAPAAGAYVQPTAGGATGVDEGTSPPALVGEQP